MGERMLEVHVPCTGLLLVAFNLGRSGITSGPFMLGIL